MTNQLIIPKIILTSDSEVAKIFATSESYELFLKNAKNILFEKTWKDLGESSLLLLTTEDSNIINFEFSILGTNAEQKGLRIVIDFFDPSEQFEKDVFKKGLSDLVNTRTFYLAFGTGSDLSNWSNFHVVSLLYAESFQDYDQPKTIRLNLVSTAGLHEISDDIFTKYSKDLKSINISTSLTASAAIQPFSSKKSDEAQAKFDEEINKRSRSLSDLEEEKNTLIKNKEKFQNSINKTEERILEASAAYDESWVKQKDFIEALRARGGFLNNARVTELSQDIQKYKEQINSLNVHKSNLIIAQAKLNPKLEYVTSKIRDLQTSMQSLPAPTPTLEKTDQFNYEEFLKVFRGYSGLDYVIKQVVLKFLKSVFVQQNNILFLYDDTLSNFITSGSATINQITLLDVDRSKNATQTQTQREQNIRQINLTLTDLQTNIQKYIREIQITLRPIPQDKEITPIYQQGAEKANKYSKEVTASLKIGRQEGETDDKFKEKLQEVFNSFEQAFTKQYADVFEDPCELYRETDLRIVNLFIDFVESKSSSLLRELNLVKNQPLVLFGKKSIIRALLYGEAYSITNPIFINSLARDYVENSIKQKLIKENYSLYGSKEDPLTPLQSLLDRLNVKDNEYISNSEKFISNVLIFRHNIENGNVLSITVDDYKAYNKYLSVPTDLNLFDPSAPPSLDNTDIIIQGQAIAAAATYIGTVNNDNGEKLFKFIEDLKKSKKFKSSLIVQEIASLLQSNTLLFRDNAELRSQFDKFIVEIYKKYKEGLSLDITLDNSQRSAEDVFRGMLRAVERSTFRVSIKTLPFFFVSNLAFLLEPCLLLSKRQTISGYNKNSQFDSVISGGYAIVGMKHKITKDSATSEFTLQKINTLA